MSDRGESRWVHGCDGARDRAAIAAVHVRQQREPLVFVSAYLAGGSLNAVIKRGGTGLAGEVEVRVAERNGARLRRLGGQHLSGAHEAGERCKYHGPRG